MTKGRMKEAALIVCLVLIIAAACHVCWTLVGVALVGMAATSGAAAGFLPLLAKSRISA